MTVLYDNQWYDERGNRKVFVHYNTKNRSFMRMVQVLQDLGVKNNHFFLALYDPDLLDVDPFELTEENDPGEIIRTKVIVEASKNLWYFLRELIRIPASGGSPVPYRLDRGNLCMAWCFANEIDVNITQPRQSGKALRASTPVKVPGGWEEIGNLKVGDRVTSVDGTPTTVTGVYPQGKLQLYRITFEDGRTVDCCADHLWKVHNPHWSPSDTRWRVVPTKDLIDRFEKHPNSQARFAVPLCAPEEGDEYPHVVDPYVMGTYIGNGCTRSGGIKFSTNDTFVIEKLQSLLGDTELVHERGCDWKVFPKDHVKGHAHISSFHTAMRDSGLWGLYSWQKYIPENYLKGSVEQRLRLLQGLMDSDGTVCKRGSSSYSTTSPRLASQIRRLVWSLGGTCKISPKQTHYTYKSERKAGLPSFNVWVHLPNPHNSVTLPRKKERLPENYKYKDTFKLHIKSIEKIDTDEAVCISVDHPERLFVTDNYIVTHNTISSCSLATQSMYLKGYNSKWSMVTHSTTLAVENVERVTILRDNLPEWMVKTSTHDIENRSEIKYAYFKNQYRSFLGSSSEEGANRVGRGCSAPVIHFDEMAFIPNIRIVFQAIMPSTDAVRELARANGQYCSNIMTTTAGDPTTDSGKYALEIIGKAMKFSEMLYDCPDKDALNHLLERNSKNMMITATFSYLMLGKTREWFHKVTSRNNMSLAKIKLDYLNQWGSSVEETIVDKKFLDRMVETRKLQVPYTEYLDGFQISWYVTKAEFQSPLFAKKKFVIGCDTSKLVGEDFTTLVGVDPETMNTLFTVKANQSNTIAITLLILTLMMRYKNSVLIMENASTAVGIFDNLVDYLITKGENPFRRMFNLVVDRKQNKEFRDINLADTDLARSSMRKYLGFFTTSKTRPVLYKQVLNRMAELCYDRVFDDEIVTQLCSLAKRTDGRIDHKSGGHDDMVIAWLLAGYLILLANNVQFYGLDAEKLLKSSRSASGALVDPGYITRQMDLRKKIALITQMHDDADAEFLKTYYRREISKLKEQVDEDLVLDPVAASAVSSELGSMASIYVPEVENSGPTVSIREATKAIFGHDTNGDPFADFRGRQYG